MGHDTESTQQQMLAIVIHNAGDNVFVRAKQDVEILAPCVTDNPQTNRNYSRTNGHYFLETNDEVLLPIPPNATPHIHVRLTSGKKSQWTYVDLSERNHHTSAPMSQASMQTTTYPL